MYKAIYNITKTTNTHDICNKHWGNQVFVSPSHKLCVVFSGSVYYNNVFDWHGVIALSINNIYDG